MLYLPRIVISDAVLYKYQSKPRATPRDTALHLWLDWWIPNFNPPQNTFKKKKIHLPHTHMTRLTFTSHLINKSATQSDHTTSLKPNTSTSPTTCLKIFLKKTPALAHFLPILLADIKYFIRACGVYTPQFGNHRPKHVSFTPTTAHLLAGS